VAEHPPSNGIDLQPVSAPDLPEDPAAAWPEVREVGVRLPLRIYLAEVWRRREFAVTVPLGELRAQNQDTVLGQLWHLLNPLMLIGIYFFLFQVVLNVESRRGVDNYLAFLTVGVITFNYTRSSIQSGARMIVKNRKLVQSINFPRAILPLSSMVAETVSHLYAIPVMFLVVLLAPGGIATPVEQGGVRPMWSWLLIVPVMLVQLLFNLGAGMITARLAFHFRDVQQFLPYLLRLTLYASGVIIPLTIIEQDLVREILKLNPIYNLIEMARGAVLYGTFEPRTWLIGVTSTLTILVVGFWFFRRAENEYGNV
jgi:teichoic acid transport system permease protein